MISKPKSRVMAFIKGFNLPYFNVNVYIIGLFGVSRSSIGIIGYKSAFFERHVANCNTYKKSLYINCETSNTLK